MAASRFSRAYQNWVRNGGFYTLILGAAWSAVAEFSFAMGTHSYYSYLGKSFLALVLLEAFRRAGDRASPLLARAGTLSFGIFFVHSYIISGGKMLEMRLFGHAPDGSFIGVALATALALLISMVVVNGVRRLLGPKYSRMAIGC
jgi:peptidoglycan/LPS O-acetylase OafA/YrhL